MDSNLSQEQRSVFMHKSSMALMLVLLMVFFFWEKGTFLSIRLQWPVIGLLISLPFMFLRTYSIRLFPIIIVMLMLLHCLNLAMFYLLNIDEPNQSFNVVTRSLFTVVITIVLFRAITFVGRDDFQRMGKVATYTILIALSLLILMAWLSYKPIDFMIFDFLNGRFKAVDVGWRRMFANYSEEILISDSGNYRNAIASCMFALLVMTLPNLPRIDSVVALVLGSLCIVLLLSASGVLMLSVLFWMLAALKNPKYGFLILGALIALAAAALFFIYSDSFGSEYLQGRLAGSLDGRLGHIKIGWEDIINSNFLGEYVGYQIFTHEGYILYPHNMFVGVWLNGGLLGLTIFLALYLLLASCFVGFTLWGLAQRNLLIASGALALVPFLLRSQLGPSVSYFMDYGSAIGVSYFMAVYCLTKKRGVT